MATMDRYKLDIVFSEHGYRRFGSFERTTCVRRPPTLESSCRRTDVFVCYRSLSSFWIRPRSGRAGGRRRLSPPLSLPEDHGVPNVRDGKHDESNPFFCMSGGECCAVFELVVSVHTPTIRSCVWVSFGSVRAERR